jgi:hypothetical protein
VNISSGRYNLLMSLRWASSAVVLGSLCLPARGTMRLAANGQSFAEQSTSVAEVRQVILNSRHLGAHGLGYNDESLRTLSERLTPEDIPALIELLADKDLRVGVQFALASQCEAAIIPVRQATAEHKLTFFEAEDTMRLIEEFSTCTAATRQVASATRLELHALGEDDQRRLEQEAKERASEDARIQRNGLKMLDPNHTKELTRQEREEVYRRSLKALGLKEDGPLTPEQRELVRRMYRTMVLGESSR